MTLQDLKRFQEWLKEYNAQRLTNSVAIMEPFYPHDFLRADSDMAADFTNFVFLKSTEADITEMVNTLTTDYRIRLRHYLDTDRSKATVPDRMMQAFLDACVKHRGQIEIMPPIGSIEVMDRVRIKNGPFAGQEASVMRVQLVRGAIHLELAMQLLTGVMSIRMTDVTKNQVEILNREAGDNIRTDFIEYTQNHLLTILEHRIKRVDDATVNKRDADMLTRLYRYRYYEVKNEAARQHFMALMLICAHLCRYTAEEANLRAKTQELLERINRKSESKAATDTRTYLWIALYISTRDPAYRDAAKQYVRDHQPRSSKLRRFVSLIRRGVKV